MDMKVEANKTTLTQRQVFPRSFSGGQCLGRSPCPAVVRPAGPAGQPAESTWKSIYHQLQKNLNCKHP